MQVAHGPARWILLAGACVAIGALTYVASVGMGQFFAEKQVRPPEKYDELEFVVVHRPHVTYFVDIKYTLCFATRKPNYQDLVQFRCTERLWQEVKAGHRGGKRSDAGNKD